MGYQTVLFDMDGTILNTLSDITDSINHMLREMGYPLRTEDEVRAFLGNGSMALVKKSLGDGTGEDQAQRAFRLYRSWYADHADIKTSPYEGIAELMRKLREKGIKAAVASNKPEATVRLLCDRHFPGLVNACVGDVDSRRRKPYPDMIDAVLQDMGADKDRAVYIGDTEVDVQTARNAGLACISVSWGFRLRRQLEESGASVIADSVQELERLLTE